MIDKKAITLYFDDDHELFKRFVGRFVEQTPALLRAIKKHIAAEQLSEASNALHALKGHLRYLGLGKLSNELEALEKLVEQPGNTEAIIAGWQKFNRAFAPAYKFLQVY